VDKQHYFLISVLSDSESDNTDSIFTLLFRSSLPQATVKMKKFVYNNKTHAVVIYNACYGGYGISDAAKQLLNIRDEYAEPEQEDNPALLRAIETLGFKGASSEYADLKAALVPRDALPDVSIHEYDGKESVWIDVGHYIKRKTEEHFVSHETMTRQQWQSVIKRSKELEVEKNFDMVTVEVAE
jgi:hypothetical protein